MKRQLPRGVYVKIKACTEVEVQKLFMDTIGINIPLERCSEWIIDGKVTHTMVSLDGDLVAEILQWAFQNNATSTGRRIRVEPPTSIHYEVPPR